MESDSSRRALAWLTGPWIALLAACGGGGDGTGPPPSDGGGADLQAAAGVQAAEASAAFEQQVTSGNPDPVGALITDLQADPNITQVEYFDYAGSVMARSKDGIPFTVLVAEQNRSEWVAGSGAAAGFVHALGKAGPPLGLQVAPSPINCDPTNFPQSKRACVFRTIDFDEFGGEDAIEPALQRAGFEVTSAFIPTRAEELVGLQQTLSTCGVLYLSAHGGVAENLADERGNHILTDIEIGEPGNIDSEKFLAQLRVLRPAFGDNYKRFFGHAAHAGKTYLTLSPQFFASVQYPNTLVFANACASDSLVGDGTQLRNAFREHGAGGFLGWKRSVASTLANPTATEIFNALAPKVASIDAVAITISPPKPTAGQPYTPSATITPAQEGVEVSLSVRGTDGFTRDETQTTDASGSVRFTEIPGGQGGVTDIVTVAAGGASSSATALNAVYQSPALQTAYTLPWFLAGVSVNTLSHDLVSPEFNLVCNNSKVTKTETVVKFSPSGSVAAPRVTLR